jgi:hypothetical protein
MAKLLATTWRGRLLLALGIGVASILVMGHVSRETRERPRRTYAAHLAQEDWGQALLMDVTTGAAPEWSRVAAGAPLAILEACARPLPANGDARP